MSFHFETALELFDRRDDVALNNFNTFLCSEVILKHFREIKTGDGFRPNPVLDIGGNQGLSAPLFGYEQCFYFLSGPVDSRRYSTRTASYDNKVVHGLKVRLGLLRELYGAGRIDAGSHAAGTAANNH
ncbi:MAG: hypothetical protein HYT13_01185 [Candidatus Liptonbacteria bacterium]|nr:hypothetical protein [Candidatus Liptonbacteria bacterium]